MLFVTDKDHERPFNEILRLNNQVKSLYKDNLNLLSSNIMLRKQNRSLKIKVTKLNKRICRLENELELII